MMKITRFLSASDGGALVILLTWELDSKKDYSKTSLTDRAGIAPTFPVPRGRVSQVMVTQKP
jgi:hypothetical protein